MTETAALASTAFLLRLARSLLSKAERSSAPEAVSLALDRSTAPELHQQTDAENLQLWVMQLEDLCRTGWTELKLAPAREFAIFTDRKPRLELRDFDALATWAGYTPRAQRWQRQWLSHLAEHWAQPDAQVPARLPALLDYLGRNPLTMLEGLPLQDATRSLETIQAQCLSGACLTLRALSAQAFQGRSKILDNREELLRLLGAAPGQFRDAPIQLLLALPAEGSCRFDDVVFIENLVTFEQMADRLHADGSRSLLVYAAGFRGSARRLRTRDTCRLYLRADPRQTAESSQCLRAVEQWLFDSHHRPVFFFGDLDYSGMQILKALGEVFPGAQAWRPGYEALVQALEHGDGHSPDQAGKELQLDPVLTSCAYADGRLLPAIRARRRFIDQEAFVPPHHN